MADWGTPSNIKIFLLLRNSKWYDLSLKEGELGTQEALRYLLSFLLSPDSADSWEERHI